MGQYLNKEGLAAGIDVVVALRIAAPEIAEAGGHSEQEVLVHLLEALAFLVGDVDIVKEAAEAAMDELVEEPA